MFDFGEIYIVIGALPEANMFVRISLGKLTQLHHCLPPTNVIPAYDIFVFNSERGQTLKKTDCVSLHKHVNIFV